MKITKINRKTNEESNANLSEVLNVIDSEYFVHAGKLYKQIEEKKLEFLAGKDLNYRIKYD